jgi:thiamine-monophosphate kinase
MSELVLIERIAARHPTRPGTILGIGDDAAVLEVGGPAIVTHDMLVEGVHFRRTTTGLRDLGHKALAVNLSDLAAMGAVPVAVIVGLGLPAGALSPDEVDEIYLGMDDLALAHGVTVAGGDTTTCPTLVLAITAVGRAVEGVPPARRSGARPGDVLCVTGALGAAAAGLLLLDDPGLLPAMRERTALIDAHRRPVPRLAAGRALAAGGARAMMDISDGLVLDAGRMAAASGLRARIELSAVPLADGVAVVATAVGADPALMGATAGEDYELLAAVRPGALAGVRAGLDLPLTVVGALVEGDPGVDLLDASGALVDAGRGGWQHEL